ncbi:uncharacterized protein LOC122139889 [Cyprinus carpio]|uniref:Uncharacterized protein LOC122139889 n=1 Tax=Cyprinus carpio TaxID=7962 RepID=A0A9R0AES2_CYPCA|nr:uncharacterized protein LOC122139889 [Cyprinus carpio]
MSQVTATTNVSFFAYFTSVPRLVPPQTGRESARSRLLGLLLRSRLQRCHVISLEHPLTHSKPPEPRQRLRKIKNTLNESPPAGVAERRLQRTVHFGFSSGTAGDPLCGNTLSHAAAEGQAEEGVLEGQKGAQTGHAGGAGAGDDGRSTDAHRARAAHRPLRLRGYETRSHRVKRLQTAKSPLSSSFSFISPRSFPMNEMDTIIRMDGLIKEWFSVPCLECVKEGVFRFGF